MAMNDITKYFTSPNKGRKSAESVNSAKSAEAVGDQNVNTDNEIKQNSNLTETAKKESKRKKKKRRRKSTDPEVQNIAELLSSNLSLISPNANGFEACTPSPTIRISKRAKRKTSKEEIGTIASSSNSISIVSESNKITDSKTSKFIKDLDSSKNAQRKSSNKEVKSNASSSSSSNFIVSQSNKNSNTKSSKVIIDIDNSTDKSSLESDHDIEVITEIQQENTSSQKLVPKVNAFQFLMSSRNNVIGQNSEGKPNKEKEFLREGKEKLEARKNLFKSWADQKGVSKRKRDDKEVEKCINLKMEKRAKRLKKLIQGDKKEDTIRKNDNHEFPVKPKKKVKKLSSSESENSNDLTTSKQNKITETANSSLSEVTEIVAENAQDAIITKCSSPLKKHSGQNDLLSFFGVLTKVDKSDTVEVFEELPEPTGAEVIKVKMFTPQRSKKPVYSLNKSFESVRADEFNQKGGKIKKHKNKRHKTSEVKESLQLNDLSKEFCLKIDEPIQHSSRVENFKRKKHKIKGVEETSQSVTKLNDSMEDFCVSLDGSDLKQNSVKKEHKKNKLKRNMCKKKSTNKNNSLKSNRGTKENAFSFTDMTCIVNVDVSSDESTKDSDIVNIKSKKSKLYVIDDESVDLLTTSKELKVITPSSRKKVHKEKATVIDCRHIEDSEEGKEKTLKYQNTPVEGRTLRKRSTVNYKVLHNMPKSTKKDKEDKTASAKKQKKHGKDESIEKVELSSDSESEVPLKKKTSASVKMAPVFLKATPKPKVDPEIIEARKIFLLSGIPDSLKKTVEKQKNIEEKEYDVFPTISHIQQKCDSKLWNLSHPDLNYRKEVASGLPLAVQSLKCQNLIVQTVPYKVDLNTELQKVKHLKNFLQKIKSDNPDYPVFKAFRHIYEKSGKSFLKDRSKKTPKRRSKKAQQKSIKIKDIPSESLSKDHEMWTEKYKPRSSEEILGNYHGVKELKKWLEMWMHYSEEINARKRKRINSNSESEFESTDCDSRDSTRLPGNTMIVYGPCGSGKTSAVYALANELGFNVLELNASTKRTGKRLLQELQEATQSHQVRKTEANSLNNFMNSAKKPSHDKKHKKTETDSKTKKPSSSDESNCQKDTTKMCILLLEDIDIIFEQDEGFLSSLSQLIMTSKRPIILTTTDKSPPHVQKFISQYECITFMPLSLQCLAIWLQLICLVEGLVVDKDDLGNLLEYNKGDIRKTLLEVQFWSESGGQLERNRVFSLKTAGNSGNTVLDLKAPDDEMPIEISEDEADNKEEFIHKHCLGSFEIFRVNEEYSVPENINLGMLWWNFANLLDVPAAGSDRLQRKKIENIEEDAKKFNSDIDNKKLNSVSELYDSFILTDSLFKTVNCNISNEPVVKNWSVDVLDSLEFTEREEGFSGMVTDLVRDVSHGLVDGCVKNYRRMAEASCALNMAMPDSSERRWRANQHICEDFLKGAIPLSNTLDRRSVALDYLPTLRYIARSEQIRAASNTKRGNRFRHYLKDFNINFKPNTCKLACNILNID